MLLRAETWLCCMINLVKSSHGCTGRIRPMKSPIVPIIPGHCQAHKNHSYLQKHSSSCLIHNAANSSWTIHFSPKQDKQRHPLPLTTTTREPTLFLVHFSNSSTTTLNIVKKSDKETPEFHYHWDYHPATKLDFIHCSMPSTATPANQPTATMSVEPTTGQVRPNTLSLSC